MNVLETWRTSSERDVIAIHNEYGSLGGSIDLYDHIAKVTPFEEQLALMVVMPDSMVYVHGIQKEIGHIAKTNLGYIFISSKSMYKGKDIPLFGNSIKYAALDLFKVYYPEHAPNGYHITERSQSDEDGGPVHLIFHKEGKYYSIINRDRLCLFTVTQQKCLFNHRLRQMVGHFSRAAGSHDETWTFQSTSENTPRVSLKTDIYDDAVLNLFILLF